jgi:hypothetical protein
MFLSVSAQYSQLPLPPNFSPVNFCIAQLLPRQFQQMELLTDKNISADKKFSD